jgi:heptosyltransferase-2
MSGRPADFIGGGLLRYLASAENRGLPLQIILVRVFLFLLNACLRLLHGLLFRVHHSSLLGASPRILVLRTAGLGDFIISIPALAALRRKYPNARIALLTSSTTDAKHGSLISSYTGRSGSLPWLDFVVPSTIDEALVFSGNGVRRLVGELKPAIQKFNPDFSLILADPSSRLAGQAKKLLFLKLIGARGPVFGWHLRATRAFFVRVQNARGMFVHHVQGLLQSVSETPGPNPEPISIVEFPLQLSAEADAWAERLWLHQEWTGKRVVAISPGSIQPHKRWPLEKFIVLAKQLASLVDVRIVVIGTPKDRELGDAIVQSLGGSAHNLAGLTSIPFVAALLRRCQLVVGNDGGAMHLASAVSCKAVSITPGIEFPNSIEPWGSRDLAVRHPIGCAPCYSLTHCPQGHNKCMIDLGVESVLNNALKSLFM